MNSRLKQLYVILRRYINAVRLLGWQGIRITVATLLGSKAEVTCSVGNQPLLLRLNTTDLETLLQVFWNGEYDIELPLEPAWIIDAGANVGYAAAYFAQRFPKAQIIALEPSAENFAQLQRHAERYPTINPVQAALWSEDGRMSLHDAGEGAWGFRVGQADSGPAIEEIDALSIDTLCERWQIPRIGLLKIDIEGSEKEVFAAASSWIDRVDMIIAELHDKYRSGCARAFYNATNGFSQELRKGENIVLLR